jgi:hypothetical protein
MKDLKIKTLEPSNPGILKPYFSNKGGGKPWLGKM